MRIQDDNPPNNICSVNEYIINKNKVYMVNNHHVIKSNKIKIIYYVYRDNDIFKRSWDRCGINSTVAIFGGASTWATKGGV
jgi:hypothetical protein